MTKKERRKVYLKAAKIIAHETTNAITENNWSIPSPVCTHLMNLTGILFTDWGDVTSELEGIYTEFYLFSPHYVFEGDRWFNSNEAGFNERIISLLFCAEMCR